MKKFLVILLTLALFVPAFAMADDAAVTITIGATPSPHVEILEAIAPQLEAEGIKLDIVTYTDYVQPNDALAAGDLDANFFQHKPYMDDYNLGHGTNLVALIPVHYEPMGLFPGKTASLEELADGATVAVPNDVTNEARALLLLEAQGLIKLSDDAGLDATPNDIVENPKNLTFTELEAAMVPNALTEVDIAVINVNYALEAGFNPVEDALAIEDADSPYVNILVVKEGNENNAAVQALVEALHSDTVRDFILEKYDGAVVPAF